MSGLRVASHVSVASMTAAGLLGAALLVPLGPPLAMGAAMWLGDTEPDVPARAYPWAVFGLGLLLVAGGSLAVQRGDRPGLGSVVAHAGAVVVGVLPLVHVWLLWRRT